MHIFKDPATGGEKKGAMYCPVILGADTIEDSQTRQFELPLIGSFVA